MAKKTPLLTISSDYERDVIQIYNKEYEIRSQSELSLVDYHRLKSTGNKIKKAFDKDDLSDNDVNTLTTMIDRMSTEVFVEPPKEILAKLNQAEKFEIVKAFLGRLSPLTQKAEIPETTTQ